MESVGIDKISSLPDDILIQVLSFMTAKKAVQTCILSKRWRNVWASMPVLKLDRHEFGLHDDRYDNRYKFGIHDDSDDRFMQFANAVLLNREPSPLDTFEYFYVCSDIYHFSVNLLDRVVALKPRVISINFNISEKAPLPDSVFSCASVQELKLYFSSIAYKTVRVQSINLPSLKVLNIHGGHINNDFTQKLFFNCPNLESLSLDHCILNISDITSDVLKEMDIHFWKHHKTRISCPALRSLSIHFRNAKGDISLDSMPLLANAVIRLDEDDHSLGLPIRNVLRCISNATMMTFVGCHQLKGRLERDILNCGIFDNLKNLVIGEWDMINDFDLIACFLKNSPNLRKLTLHLGHEERFLQKPRRDVFFKHEYLETVKISCGNKVERASELVKILWRHVKTIGNVIVV